MSDEISRWVKEWVVAENICPFANKVIAEQSLRISCCGSEVDETATRFLLQELALIYESSEKEISTSLLVFPNLFADFDDYLDFLADAENLLEEAGLVGQLQIASFHPHYCFQGVDETAVSNYTNRSPYPLLHLIREQQLEEALKHYPEPEQIPENNIKHLEQLGLNEVLQRLHAISEHYPEPIQN